MKKHIALLLVILAALALPGCTVKEEPGVGGSTTRSAVESGELQFAVPEAGARVAVIETSMGVIRAVLYPRQAPVAVANFTGLAGGGAYDGTLIHRVVKDFIIQGGDPTGTGLGGASIWGRPFATERSDALRHYAGALCMAAADETPDTHQSQFYIVACPQGGLAEADLQALRDAGVRDAVVDTYARAGGAPWLDNTDTVFGQVIAGMDVVDAIAAAAAGEDERPKTAIEIIRVTVESYRPPAPSGVSQQVSP